MYSDTYKHRPLYICMSRSFIIAPLLSVVGGLITSNITLPPLDFREKSRSRKPIHLDILDINVFPMLQLRTKQFQHQKPTGPILHIS